MWYEKNKAIFNLDRYHQIYINCACCLVFFDGHEFEEIEFESETETEIEFERNQRILRNDCKTGTGSKIKGYS